jgi:hypothetical protein
MKWFAELRILAYARRMVRALEDIADSHRMLARIAEKTWDENHRPRKGSGQGPYKRVVVGQFDQDAANKRWHEQEVAAGRESDNGEPL